MKPHGLGSTAIGLGVVVALLYFGRLFLVTLCTAVIIAFILEPFVVLLMRIRIPRPVASFVICSLGLCVVYLLGLGVYTQVAGVIDDYPKFSQRINEITDQVVERVESTERWVSEVVVPKRFRTQPPPPQPPPAAKRTGKKKVEPVSQVALDSVQEVRIRPERSAMLGWIYLYLGSAYNILLMASFVPFLVYFMLSWRDHLYHGFLRLFEEEGRLMASRSVDGIASMVRAFVVGNSLLGIILAIISTLVFWWFRLPYPVLLGPLSGVLSLVPYIGLPLALLPPLVGALAVYNILAPYAMILSVVAVLHLIAMNLLYPKIVGPRVHLNPLVVTVALMFWSVLWGAPGLILAIPLTAGLKAVCDNVKQLEPYGQLLGD